MTNKLKNTKKGPGRNRLGDERLIQNTIYLRPDQVDWLMDFTSLEEKEKGVEDISISEIARRAIDDFMERHTVGGEMVTSPQRGRTVREVAIK